MQCCRGCFGYTVRTASRSYLLRACGHDNLDVVKRWESAYGIPEKRSTKSAEQRKSELDAAREEGRVAARSEQMLPNTRPVGQGSSPVFRQVAQGPSKLQRPAPTNRMEKYAQSLESGKYKDFKMPQSA